MAFTIKGEGFELGAEVSVPAGLARTADLLPLAQGFSDRVVQETTKAMGAAGHRISCRKGEQFAADDSGEVVRVRMLMPVFHAVAQWRTVPPKHLMERVVPLILAPEWAAAHPEAPPSRTGPELLQELLELLRVKREL